MIRDAIANLSLGHRKRFPQPPPEPRLHGKPGFQGAKSVQKGPTAGFLTLASFIIHYLDWQARNTFWEHFPEMSVFRPSEANSFVNIADFSVPIRLTSSIPVYG
jgi:hypothetical protein